MLFVAAGLGWLAATLPFAGGLRVRLKNDTTHPLSDVQIVHSGGRIAVGRLAPGESVHRTIRAGWLRAGRGDVPVDVRFQHGRGCAVTRPIAYDLGWLGRSVDYVVREGPNREVLLSAWTEGDRHFDASAPRLNRLPSLRCWRRMHGYDQSVIPRGPEFVARRMLEDSIVLGGYWIACPGLRLRIAGHAVSDLVRKNTRDRHRVPRPMRLPFRNDQEVLDDYRANLSTELIF